jgi:hypothetical protein
MRDMKSMPIHRKIQYAVFFLFVLDVLLLGAGKNLPGLGVSSRKFWFVLFAMISAVVFVIEDSARRMTDILLLSAATIFLLVWMLLIPIFTHGNIVYATTDATPLAALVIFLFTTEFVRYRAGWIWVRRLMFGFLVCFAFVHIVLFLYLRLYPGLQPVISGIFQSIFDVGSGEDARFVFFTPLESGVYRIYFGSSFLLLLGLYFVVARPVSMRLGRLRLEYVFALLLLSALWATNTRSLLFGAVTFVALYPFCIAFFKKIEQSYWSIFFLLALPLFLSFLLVPTVDPSTLKMLDLGRSVSDDVRAAQFDSLFDAFRHSPFWGIGFGSSATFIRAPDTPYAYELSIVGLAMKTGVMGLLLACAGWAAVLNSFRVPGTIAAARPIAALYALYFAFMFSCFYNPYMFGLYGTFFLLFILYEFSFVTIGAAND